MNAESQKLLESILALSETERAEIAATLIESLEPQRDDATDAAWAAEIRRRLKSLDEGDVQLIPWSQISNELAERGDG